MAKIVGQVVVRGQKFNVIVGKAFGFRACERCALHPYACFQACQDFARIHGGDCMYMYLKEKESNEE